MPKDETSDAIWNAFMEGGLQEAKAAVTQGLILGHIVEDDFRVKISRAFVSFVENNTLKSDPAKLWRCFENSMGFAHRNHEFNQIAKQTAQSHGVDEAELRAVRDYYSERYGKH